jgi:hypothetical protein
MRLLWTNRISVNLLFTNPKQSHHEPKRTGYKLVYVANHTYKTPSNPEFLCWNMYVEVINTNVTPSNDIKLLMDMRNSVSNLG